MNPSLQQMMAQIMQEHAGMQGGNPMMGTMMPTMSTWQDPPPQVPSPEQPIFLKLLSFGTDKLSPESFGMLSKYFGGMFMQSGCDNQRFMQQITSQFEQFLETPKGKEWFQAIVDAFFGAMAAQQNEAAQTKKSK